MEASKAGEFLQFANVKKTYDQKTLVVKNFNLDVKQGEFVTLLGPSGSGKTTVLMMLAGFENVTSGTITMDGRPITKTAPYKRNIGMVFQNYALFPHMTVAENLAYPLTVRKMPKVQIRQRVDEYLKLIELSHFGNRHPGQLSGGQRQRVALARALIFEPTLVLMDEPLGALDKKLREQMQFEITRLHKQLGFTVIYVTHDQVEALTMSSRIAVFNEGVVQQYAAPDDLYERPANAFVANFIGENNLISAQAPILERDVVRSSLPGGTSITAQNGNCQAGDAESIISVRPEKLVIQAGGPVLDNQVEARFITRHYVGDFIRYYFELPSGGKVAVKTLNDTRAPDLRDGQTTTLGWRTRDCFAFRKEPLPVQGELQ
ncbi:ABC transporter ATP-binding protein [Allopusillimonas soli]|uniref:Spermidine/putrescine import ATP-binding protein PotA n=1 Tax=Allopusillimonas soli TaxID=659016 RepID=A0A853F7E7_9BURK|nr:ABC transporter ATP-binding protein [Allopusillimonas soli]NYT36515.1 ABC transporter ATP-binding protein [Allopusillimonas soli]TEA75017.1 ABC transporter ATP-binding protein [Allopusillimonas soli]